MQRDIPLGRMPSASSYRGRWRTRLLAISVVPGLMGCPPPSDGSIEPNPGDPSQAVEACARGSTAQCDNAISMFAEANDPGVVQVAALACAHGSPMGCPTVEQLVEHCNTAATCQTITDGLALIHDQVFQPGDLTAHVANAYIKTCNLDSGGAACASGASFVERHVPQATEQISAMWKEACDRSADASWCQAYVKSIFTGCQSSNDQVCKAGFDTACHTLHDADSCQAMVLISMKESDIEKVLEHMNLACQYGNPELCRDFVTSLKRECTNNDGSACLTLAGLSLMPENPLVDYNPTAGRKLMKRACRLGVAEACRLSGRSL